MILLIHEVKSWMLKPNLCDPFSTITFDDALYSQYYCAEHFLSLGKKRLILFVSTGIVHHGDGDQIKDISCYDAHNRFFKTGDTRPYMTKKQILDLYNKGFEIGLHGVTHQHLPNNLKGMRQALEEAKASYQTLTEWGIKPTCMSYPYNEPNPGFKILSSYYPGFEYFGDERIEIERFYDQY